jgi:hypothetical protein
MNIEEAIRRLAIHWWPEIQAAKDGDPTPLIDALRSNKPLPPSEERLLRDSLAGLLAGEFKRPRGRPRRKWRPAWSGPANPALWLAVDYVRRYKLVQARRYGRRWGVEAEAVAKAAAKYEIGDQRIVNYIRRSQQPRRKTTAHKSAN